MAAWYGNKPACGPAGARRMNDRLFRVDNGTGVVKWLQVG